MDWLHWIERFPMKLIVAIIQDRDSEPVTQALIAGEYRVTRIASSGGWLRRGSTTLMIGVDEDKVDGAIEVIRASTSQPNEPNIRRATLFVLSVANFEQI